METVRLGVIGLGLMGRELGSVVARWCHLTDMPAKPEITAICARRESSWGWFLENFPTIRQATPDWRELLANPDVDAVYCAVPHDLHREIYCATIEAGKALFGEKPFGIDRPANDAIMACIAEHPDVFVRCCSQFPFYPGAQRVCRMIEDAAFGRIIEVNTGFMHSSDLNPEKAINWKRMIEANGEYGCMGDLGMHVCHVGFKAGWRPLSVRAVLSNIMAERPDGEGRRVPCETWDNATLLCEAEDTGSGDRFPWTIKTQRIAPGEVNTWYMEVKGTRACARWTTKNPRCFEKLEYAGGKGDQAWQRIDLGYETAYPTISGSIFEFGFSDAILQMWAAFLKELVAGPPSWRFAGTATPDETALSHRLFTAALRSQAATSCEPV